MGLSITDLPAAWQRKALDQLRTEDAQREAKREPKYHNNKATVAGIRFDSKKEANRYAQLMAEYMEGLIDNLKLQREYTLQEAYKTHKGERIRAIRYRADFDYDRQTPSGVIHIVEDTKGVRTKDYKIKFKLMAEKFGIMIKEI